MSEVKSRDAELTPLLRRAIMDDGPEADNAFFLFKKRLRRSALDVGNIYYLDKAMNNPLLFVVRQKEAENALLREELAEAYETINNDDGGGSRAPAFPWEDYPEEELAMCQDFTSKKAVGPSIVNRWIKKLSKISEIEVKEGSIKQRLNNNVPPKKLIEHVAPMGSPASWKELWFIGSMLLEKRAWKAKLFERLALDNRPMGSEIKDITPDIMDRLRAEITTMIDDRGISWGDTLNYVIRTVHAAGPEGMTKKAVTDTDPQNAVNLGKRHLTAVQDQSIFPLIGSKMFVHADFKETHPESWQAAVKAQEKRLADRSQTRAKATA
jgi:hypothetical protein